MCITPEVIGGPSHHSQAYQRTTRATTSKQLLLAANAAALLLSSSEEQTPSSPLSAINVNAAHEEISLPLKAEQQQPAKKFLSRKQLAERVGKGGESLVIINDKIYNLTKWLPHHPGGELAIKHMAGKDATDAMLVLHPAWVMDKIHSFYIADLAKEDVVASEISRDFQALDAHLRKLGLYKSNPWFWRREIFKFTLLWVGMVYFCVYGNGNDWSYLLSALMASQLWHQAAFVAHDAGHSGISQDRVKDTLFAVILADFFGGLSIGWWKLSHYVHHIITNDPEHDPDIQHLPFFAITARFTQNLYSTFHKRTLAFDGFAKFFVKYQAQLYYIVLAFGRFNLYVQSWMHVLFHNQVPHRKLEIACMIGYWIWFTTMMSYMPTGWHILEYVLVSHVVTLFLHLQITLSHFGMSTEEPDGEIEETFAEKALRTSMDVDCPRWLDWFHGGLQFQVEHHLFPRLPRHNLRQVQPLVKAFAKRHNLPFHSYTFSKANGFVLGAMQDVANQIGAIVAADKSHIQTQNKKLA